MKLTRILAEIELDIKQNNNTVDTRETLTALDQAAANSFRSLKSQLTDSEHISEINDDINTADIKLNEAFGILGIIGLLLAAPKLLELLVRGFSYLVKAYKKIVGKNTAKTEEEQVKVAEQIITFTHKWHKFYIGIIEKLLKVSGIFKRANIKSTADQRKAAEVVYYTIVAGLAVYSGVQAISAFKTAIVNVGETSNFAIGTLETVLASIKTTEVKTFLAKIMSA